MKCIITIFVTALFQQVLFAQTNVKGTFSQDTRWTINESPYNVTGNVGVPDGITLTVDPGVVINFNTVHQIIVQGALVVNGTVKEPVIINGNQAGAAMLLFQKTNLSNSSMNYLTMNGPKNGIEFRDFDNITNKGRLVINRLKISNSCIATLGTNIQAVIEINNSELTNSRTNNATKDEAIIINNSKITGGEITVLSDLQPITLNEDTCYNTTFTFGSYGILQAESCLFYNVRFGPNNNNGKLTLKSSSLYNSGINMWGCEVNITACVLRFDSDYKEPYCIRAGIGLISSSDFTGNGKIKAIDRAYSSGNYSHGYDGKFHVADCEFRSFKTYFIGREWQWNGRDTNTSIKRCNFMDPISDSAIISLSKYNIIASNNWWGTASESLIKNSIHDFWDDIIYGKVIYTGFLSKPIVKTGLFKINSVSAIPSMATAFNPIRIITKTYLPGYGRRVSGNYYIYRDTIFIETCYSQGIGLAAVNIADTFDIGYLSIGNHPIVYRAKLSGSSEYCSPLETSISQTNIQVNPPEINLYGISSIPISPLRGDKIKIATAMYVASNGYRLSKNHFIRNDTVFLGLCYYAVSGSQKSFRDTFELNNLNYGDYKVMLSVSLTLRPDSCKTIHKIVFKSKLSVGLAALTDYKVTTLPSSPVEGEEVTVYTEVSVNPFGKLLSENHFIRNDTIFLEQCYYAGSGSKNEIVKGKTNIGKLTKKIYTIRFITRLSPDSNECKPGNTGVYDRYLFVYQSVGLNSLSDKDLTISPNPFNDQVSLSGMNIERLEIYDLTGQLIKKFERPEGNLIENLSSLPLGLFIFQVTTPDGKVIRKKMLKN